MIKDILLDLDDTIFDFEKAEKYALLGMLKYFGIKADEETVKSYNRINRSQWKLLECGRMTRGEVRVKRFEILFEKLKTPQISAGEATRLYESELCKNGYLIEGAREFLKTATEKYRLYAVTNGFEKTQKNRIKAAGIEKYFDDIFISEEIGYDKPDVRFFERCFEKIPHFKREEALIAGDSISSDIAGGKNAKIITVWYNRTKKELELGDIFPDYTISDLKEIYKLTDSINGGKIK